jgi:hypothetical protein
VFHRQLDQFVGRRYLIGKCRQTHTQNTAEQKTHPGASQVFRRLVCVSHAVPPFPDFWGIFFARVHYIILSGNGTTDNPAPILFKQLSVRDFVGAGGPGSHSNYSNSRTNHIISANIPDKLDGRLARLFNTRFHSHARVAQSVGQRTIITSSTWFPFRPAAHSVVGAHVYIINQHTRLRVLHRRLKFVAKYKEN